MRKLYVFTTCLVVVTLLALSSAGGSEAPARTDWPTDYSYMADQVVELNRTGEPVARIWAVRQQTIYANPAYDTFDIRSNLPVVFHQGMLFNFQDDFWAISSGITVTLKYAHGDPYGFKVQSDQAWTEKSVKVATPTP